MKRKLFSTILLLLFANLVSAQFEIGEPSNLTTCSGSSTGTFDLTMQDAAVLGTLDPADYTVSYHLSEADAQADANPIMQVSAFTGSNNQQVFVRVEDNADPTNFELASFTLFIEPVPFIDLTNYQACDYDDNPSDGTTLIDLEEFAEYIYSNQSWMPTDVELTFYASMADADNQANGLESPYEVSAGNTIYVRAMVYMSQCIAVTPITVSVSDCADECLPPTSLAVSNVIGGSATFSWTPAGDETEWEVLILYSGGPFPLPTMDGIIVSENPVTFSGFECPESFDVYVRALCGLNYSDWSQPITFSVENCSAGAPQDLQACGESGTACFDLTQNGGAVLGSENPSDFVITYHLSASDAEQNVNPIPTPENYCMAPTDPETNVFMRVQTVATGDFVLYEFSISAVAVITSQASLQPMVECDEDGDGNVTFDLTAVNSQIEGDNALAFYENYQDAYDAAQPIADPTAVEVSTSNAMFTVYVREEVAADCDVIYPLTLNSLANCNISNVCAGAHSLCSALGQPFPNSTGIESAEQGNNYGCLDETPNPTWFFLPVSAAGSIELKIEQSSEVGGEADLDADFIAYGPFESPLGACGTALTVANVVSCSYSGELVEYVEINGAQPGEYYLIMVTNYSDEPGFITITDTGAGDGELQCSGLRLNAFLDENTNGIKDDGEHGFSLGSFNYTLNDSDEMHYVTAPQGIHRIYDFNASNSYDFGFAINPEYASYYSIANPNFTDVAVVEGQGLQEYLFPVTAIQAYADLSVAIIPAQEPRPGFEYTNTIVLSNLGSSEIASGVLTFEADADTTVLSVSEAGASVTPQGFTLNFQNLQPFEVREITVTMQVPVIPAVELGDLLTNIASVDPISGDVFEENDSAESSQIIVGSFDPNDKMESRGDRIVISEFGPDDYLYYTIRFENTGTAEAINISITDILDEQLDETTVSMVGASHDYTLDRVENRLTWRFENVMLPPTSEDPIASHGYVHFRVKPDAGFAAGDVIANTASIFFDFNPAIVTNTFTSTFVTSLSVAGNVADNLRIYPNPASGQVTVAFPNGKIIESVRIIDVTGKVLLQLDDIGESSSVIQTASLPVGIYMLEATDSEKSKTLKKLMIN